MLNLEKTKLWGDILAAFQYLNGAYKKDGDRFFSRPSRKRRRGNGFKLKMASLRLIMKKCFSVRVLKHWQRLLREIVDNPSLENFKVSLDGATRLN